MKKLFMSLVAVAMLSSTAFANSGEKAVAENTAKSETTTSKLTVKFIEETEEVEIDNQLYTDCKHTMVILNQSGEVIRQQTSYYTAGHNMSFKTCGEFFAYRRGLYQGLGYSLL